METNLYGGSNDDGAQFWAAYWHKKAREAAFLAERRDSRRGLERCLADWHASFEAVHGLLERL